MEQVPFTNHFLGNQLFELKGNTAQVETYCYLTHRDPRRTAERLEQGWP